MVVKIGFASTINEIMQLENPHGVLTLQQTQIPDYAELIVKFLEALIDSYLPPADEERGEEQLRTPTSPYPPTSQSQLSITANLNLSNSMTSLATSQHSPGAHLFSFL